MRFQTSQVLEIAGITKDTLRTWKRSIGPISKIDGRSGQFTLSELVGICMLSDAIQGLGIPVSTFSKYADTLFRELQHQLSPGGTPQTLYVLPTHVAFSLNVPDEGIAAYVKIAPILRRILSAIQHEDFAIDAQLDLPFQNAKVVGLPKARPAATRSGPKPRK
jgi:hypothetical protein